MITHNREREPHLSRLYAEIPGFSSTLSEYRTRFLGFRGRWMRTPPLFDELRDIVDYRRRHMAGLGVFGREPFALAGHKQVIQSRIAHHHHALGAADRCLPHGEIGHGHLVIALAL